MTPAASFASLPAIPTKKPRLSPFSTAPFIACPVKSPTSIKQTSSRSGRRRILPDLGPLGEATGREDKSLVPLRAHDVYSLHHARRPRCGREWSHDAGRPENGDAADD